MVEEAVLELLKGVDADAENVIDDDDEVDKVPKAPAAFCRRAILAWWLLKAEDAPITAKRVARFSICMVKEWLLCVHS